MNMKSESFLVSILLLYAGLPQGILQGTTVFYHYIPTFSCSEIINNTLHNKHLSIDQNMKQNLNQNPILNSECNQTQPTNQNNICNEITNCQSLNFSKQVLNSTIATEFNLVCELSSVLVHTSSILFLGTSTGGIIAGFLGDKFGRRKVARYSIVLMMIVSWSGLCVGFSGRAAVLGHAQGARRSRPVALGVSDRMANDGLLYDGWGAEGLRVLNVSAGLQVMGEEKGLNRFELALAVARRAKENAYALAEVQPLPQL